MRNEILASKHKNEKDVPLSCCRDEEERGRKKGKESSANALAVHVRELKAWRELRKRVGRAR